MAEENKKFFGTPDRFRKKARAPSANSALYGRKRSPSPAFKKTIFATMPQSPNLLTRGRTRTRCNHEEPEKPEPKKPEPKYVFKVTKIIVIFIFGTILCEN